MSKRPPKQSKQSKKRSISPVAQRLLRPYFSMYPPGQLLENDLDMLFLEAEAWYQKRPGGKRAGLTNEGSRFLQRLKDAGLLDESSEVVLLSGEKSLDGEAIKQWLIEAEIQQLQAQLQTIQTKLQGWMLEGNESAARVLVESAIVCTALLNKTQEVKPALFDAWSRLADNWPVLASNRPYWIKAAQATVGRLKLGRGLAWNHLKPSIHRVEDYPCRAWPARAIEVLEHNRRLEEMLKYLRPYLRSERGNTVTWSEYPDWVGEALRLSPFCKDTAGEWALAARHMISDQVPELLERPELAQDVSDIRGRYKKATAEVGETEGRVRHALLDKIAGAIRSLAD